MTNIEIGDVGPTVRGPRARAPRHRETSPGTAGDTRRWLAAPGRTRALILARACADAATLTRFGDDRAVGIAAAFAGAAASSTAWKQTDEPVVRVRADAVEIIVVGPVGDVFLVIDEDFPPCAAAAHTVAAVVAGNRVTLGIPSTSPIAVLSYLGIVTTFLPDDVLRIALLCGQDDPPLTGMHVVRLAAPGGCPQLAQRGDVSMLYQQRSVRRMPLSVTEHDPLMDAPTLRGSTWRSDRATDGRHRSQP
ncbi:hypothetical protein BJK06_16825 [Curtobacterium sp. BH-2-1-1]|nr:hypothetical protein BJK06_16825 [Curtobacterium sp. BH-2-1-1]